VKSSAIKAFATSIRLLLRTAISIGVLLCVHGQLHATPFTPGDILISGGNPTPSGHPLLEVREYTRGGVLVQTIDVPTPAGEDSQYESLGGVLIDTKGDMAVASYNGIGIPYLSFYHPNSQTWTQVPFPIPGNTGAPVLNNRDISQYKNKIFVIRSQCDVSNNNAVSALPSNLFPQNSSTTDYTTCIGQDGKMYAVDGTNLQQAWPIVVSDPATLTPLRQLVIADGLWTHAVAADGMIFTATDSKLLKYSASGTLLGQLATSGLGSICSLQLDSGGTLMATSQNGKILLTDRNFSTQFQFTTGNLYPGFQCYGSFVPTVPEPASVALLAVGAVTLAGFRIFFNRRFPHQRHIVAIRID
jgi:hypothetical protein